MKELMKIKRLLTSLFIVCFIPSGLSLAYWVWSPETGKFVNPEGAVQDTADDQFEYAMRFFREKDYDEAIKQLKNLLKKYPASAVAPKAQYRLGTIYEQKENYKDSVRAYQKLIASYPQSDRFEEVIERMFRIGNLFLSGQKAKLMGMEVLPSLGLAEEVYNHIVVHAPYSEFGDKAQFHLGLTYKKWKRYEDAVGAFQKLIDQYPQSDLVTQARFQVAETSFARSALEYRDQRALDEASRQVDRFLARHPDTTVSENAAKLRQVIDEKNAEKNYRIALYYEKQNYLQSALIYYEDVAKRYPDTKWGQSASEKLQSLQEPASFLAQEKERVVDEIRTTEVLLESGEERDEGERKRLRDRLERLKKKQKGFEKNKKDIVERKTDDLNRRERELNAKFKNLKKKRKEMKKMSSEEFDQAMERWRQSLVDERGKLDEEKKELQALREELNVPDKKLDMDFLPFVGEPVTELEKVRKMEAKKMHRISEDKRSLLEEKESLYKEHSELKLLVMETEASKLEIELGGDRFSAVGLEIQDEPVQRQRENLERTRKELQLLQEEFKETKERYHQLFGSSAWKSMVTVPAKVVTQSIDKSLEWMNPFDSEESLEKKDLEELLETRMHLKEKIAAQHSILETLEESSDSDDEIAEEKELEESLGKSGEKGPHKLRKEIKGIEREIRARYEDIGDRHKRKKRLFEELEYLLEEEDAEGPIVARVGRSVSSPFVQSGKMMKAFVFGLPDKGSELTESAERVPAGAQNASKIRSLKEEIELESLVIDGKSREIEELQKKLEEVRSEASLEGGFKFRSSIVKVPYAFIDEAVDQAKRLVPKEDREEKLKKRLAEEDGKLEELQTELRQLESTIEGKTREVDQDQKEQVARPDITSVPGEEPEMADKRVQQALQEELENLSKRIKIQSELYEREEKELQELFKSRKKQSKEAQKGESDIDEQAEKIEQRKGELSKELEKIEIAIVRLIEKENHLEEKESKILFEKIREIDRVIPKVQSRVIVEDLMIEKEKIETRLSQIESRQDFLSKEINRFQVIQLEAGSG